jgi:8-oxo-dGTP pyrophosphatase MutT (NUDIX family)
MKTRDERSAGGVVFRLRDDDHADVVLILTHEGRWQLPKGWIEDGESPAATAAREVREEAGVDAELVGPLDTISYRFTSHYDAEPARVRKTVEFFLLRYVRGSTDDHDDEVQQARWFDIDEAIAKLAFKDERRIVTLARDALRAVTQESR